MLIETDDLIDAVGIAEKYSTSRQSIAVNKRRRSKGEGLFPLPAVTICGRDFWNKNEIEEWNKKISKFRNSGIKVVTTGNGE